MKMNHKCISYIIKFFFNIWLSNTYVEVFEVKCWVCMADNFFISLYYFLQINIDKVVERINVLFD